MDWLHALACFVRLVVFNRRERLWTRQRIPQ